MTQKLSILLAMLAWLATSQVQAASLASCGATATAIAYGAYDPTNPTALTPTGSISVTCNLISGISLLVAYTISLSAGSSGSFTARKMTGTSTPMSYNLYLDGGWTQVWGDGTGCSSTKSDGYLLGVATTLTYTVYSKVPAQQLVAAGSYADSVLITISY
jgi:spore coat protein U-like protein